MHFYDLKHEINRYVAWYNEMGENDQDLMERVEYDDDKYEWTYVHLDPIHNVCYIKGIKYNMRIDHFDRNNYIIWLWQ